MTKFDRSGHYRTNQNGTTFWVSDHSVSRDDWPAGVPRPEMRVYGHDDASSVSRNVTIPNARCPVCGDPVFFFMAANGGRVFFNHLGQPWPKHGCTDSENGRVSAFADAGGIARWQQERRACLGPSASDEHLAVSPGHARGGARIVRRAGKAIAVVETSDGTAAFEVEGAWEGRSSKTVYFRVVPPPEAPETLEYLGPGLDIVALKVVARVEVPTKPSSDDFAAIAETFIADVDAWMREYLPMFRPGPRLKLSGHVVGIFGRVGRSRAVLLPVAACFDADEDEWAYDNDVVKAAERQVVEWTGKIIRTLDRFEKTRKDPLYRDLIIWVVPGSIWSFELEQLARNHNLDRTLQLSRTGVLGPPPAHVMQSMDNEIEEGVREEGLGFHEVARGERSYLKEGAKRQVEKRWLAAMIREAGLDPVFAQLEKDGVLFQFMGTVVSLPMRWGQQAMLPDGRRLLVLLHLSNPELGLAFVHFGTTLEDEYGGETYPADAIFHAKRVRTIVKFLETGAGSV
ncbi:hypothetical protein [Methylobacterium sp. 77]|uniref:hypothetical protein n=1 Tax=Methylobacterium sp. 77 TaxID=1101192 RepID=UPI000360888A|nr:hypothetical protein [Methylobacterium sp. 77]